MKRILFVVLAIMLVSTLIISGCTGAKPAETIVLKFACPEPAEMLDVVYFIEPWLKEIEEASGGRVQIERHWMESLLSLPDSYQGAVDGVADIVNIFPAMVAGKFPLDEVEFLPPMDYLTYRPSRIYADLYNKYPEVRAQYSEVKFLWHSTETGVFMTSGAKKITKLEDFKGLKMLVASATQAGRLEALGAVPVPLPPTEVYSALEKGTVDAQPATLKTLLVFKWAEVQHYLYLVRLSGMQQAFVMNLDTWNSLPSDIQKIFEDRGNEYMADVVDKARWRIYHEMVPQLVDDFGMEIVDIPPAEVARWQAAAQAGTDKYIAQLEAAGLPGREYVEEYYRLDKKYASSEYEHFSKQ